MTTPPPPLSRSALFALSQTDAADPLPPSSLLAALSHPPFVSLPGSFNTRDLGLVPGSRLKPNLFFRSGSLAGLTDEGKRVLRDELGVRTVYDLRSVAEHTAQPDPEVDGVQVCWETPGEGEATVELGKFVEGEGEEGYEWMYLGVLGMYEGAGRDRTGVASALLLALAGTDAEAVELDFMLSRIGTEPAREQLLAFALRGSGAAGVDAPGFRNMCNLRVSSWRRFVQGLEREYGGWEGYVTGALGFSDDELKVIKRNLRRED
ncbi:protein-tyrosine phosphatase-like protein [Schizothecium vesticola]|uniref:Protein-tyrosine phosphatase-like protein n=1 Tax=Schizothecium vesticola TaxID=314040 RepID=A0AA40F770_9PEZI|nr:protein-tyrosine phosphatase-like protein [Schizothecium vesticola]